MRGSGLGRSLASATRSVLIAVTTNTCSPQTMGVALPLPGSSAFHLIFFLSSQVSGGLARGAVPFASGPRQWCQLSSRCRGKSPASTGAAVTQVAKARSTRCVMEAPLRWQKDSGGSHSIATPANDKVLLAISLAEHAALALE